VYYYSFIIGLWRIKVVRFFYVAGTFRVDQQVDVIGQVADAGNPFLLRLETIETVAVRFNAISQTHAAAASASAGGRKHQPVGDAYQRSIFNQGLPPAPFGAGCTNVSSDHFALRIASSLTSFCMRFTH